MHKIEKKGGELTRRFMAFKGTRRRRRMMMTMMKIRDRLLERNGKPLTVWSGKYYGREKFDAAMKGNKPFFP